MPIPVTAWSANTFPDAKSLNLALYTSDGTADNPTGIAFLAYRPILFESYTKTTTFGSASGGSQSTMTSAATVATAVMVLDTAGYFGQTSDLPGLGAYEFTAAIAGSAGDGVTAGGWMVLSHFLPLNGTSTQTAVSADFQHIGGSPISGARQAPAGTVGSSAPFFADLANVGSNAWQPSVTIYDSGGASTTNLVNATDSSGQTPRFYAVWASVSATTSGSASYTTSGSFSWTAPAGVTAVTPACLGAGAGSGAGNVSGGGAEFGGGGGGGGEYASDTVTVTPGNNYPVTVGAAGTAGAEPGGDGTAGGNSAFSGDSVTVTGHGGSLGHGATTGANGAGGAGGTGSAAATHHNGGAGATGSSGNYGGGGGSSAGPAVAGNAGSGASGGAAPAGGGPGGNGGQAAIAVVQSKSGSNNGSGSLDLSFSSTLQAGNTVVACIYAQASAAGNHEPSTVTLNDGTALSSQVSDDVTGATAGYQTAIYTVSGISGGQTGIHLSGISGSDLAYLVQMWEVSGLGDSPGVDASASNSSNSSSYSASASPSAGPDFWAGTVGTQGFSAGSINAPSGAWNAFATVNQSQGGIYGRLRSGYQVKSTAGTMTYSGSLDSSRSWISLVLALTASASTPGSGPVVTPGGGGGAGLGTSDGAAGKDGQVALTWTGVSGGGYGTPDLPDPYSNWSGSTKLGTSGDAGVDVDLNSTSGITDVINFMSNPPVVRVQTTTAQSIANASVVAVTLASGTTSVDSYSGYSSGTYTVARDGLYLCHGQVCFAANSTGTRQAAFQINGTTYWGPGYKATSAGTTNATKTAVYSLLAGDTVKLAARQDSGGSLNTSTTDATRFFMAWLCAPGSPDQTWTPPDTTFRWSSGTPGSELGALFQTHLGNDLGFLVSRPFLMAYQTSAQSSLTVGAFSTLVLDTTGGIVHSDTGDSYSGWTSGASNKYTAPVDGWYLLCGEFFAASSAVAGATVTAGIAPSTSGGQTPSVATDYYQQLTATSTASVGGGATVLGLQYMQAGEAVTPKIRASAYAGAYSTLTGSQNSGLFRPHLEVVWLSR